VNVNLTGKFLHFKKQPDGTTTKNKKTIHPLLLPHPHFSPRQPTTMRTGKNQLHPIISHQPGNAPGDYLTNETNVHTWEQKNCVQPTMIVDRTFIFFLKAEVPGPF
jgi:hypothetical protein